MVEIERMRTAVRQAARAQVLASRLPELLEQVEREQIALRHEESSLRRTVSDLENLNGASFSALLAWLAGTKEPQLREKRNTAVRQRLVRDELRGSLGMLEDRLSTLEVEARGLIGAKAELLEAREALHLQLTHSPFVEQFRTLLEEQLLQVLLVAELREAADAGVVALESLDVVSTHLSGAARLATVDLFVRGPFVGLSKRRALEQARLSMVDAKDAFARFRSELADVGEALVVDLAVLAERDWIMDIVFDNILTDLSIRRAIATAQSDIDGARERVHGLQVRIQVMLDSAENAVSRIDEQILDCLSAADFG